MEQLTIECDFVNARKKFKEFTLVNGQLFYAERNSNSLDLIDTTDRSKAFNFPDGVPGIILSRNKTLNPNGWGDCGLCLNEQISILRVDGNENRVVLRVMQGQGSPDYCQIGAESFPRLLCDPHQLGKGRGNACFTTYQQIKFQGQAEGLCPLE